VGRFRSFNPLAFTHILPDMAASKLCEDSKSENSVRHCVYKIYGFISVKKLAAFG
jgi:hypothetical protein